MEKTIVELAESGCTLKEISEQVGRSKTTVRHYLVKNGISTLALRKETRQVVDRHCARCQTTKARNEFHSRRNNDPSPYCKLCTHREWKDRQRKFKNDCLLYKGSSCQECGYSSCPTALEFHHLDSTQKDFEISKHRGFSFTEKVREELDKCALLCCRCHREVHAGFRQL